MLIHVQSYWSNFILIAFANRDQSTYTVLEPTRFFFAPFAIASNVHCFMQYRWIYFGACALYRYRVSHIFFSSVCSFRWLLLLVRSYALPSISTSYTANKCALCVWWWNYITWNVWTSNSNRVVVALAKRQQAHIITCYQWRCVYRKNGQKSMPLYFMVCTMYRQHNHTVYITGIIILCRIGWIDCVALSRITRWIHALDSQIIHMPFSQFIFLFHFFSE